MSESPDIFILLCYDLHSPSVISILVYPTLRLISGAHILEVNKPHIDTSKMMESIQTLTFVVITIFFTLATISILLRIYSRAVLTKGFGWDDWCMTSVLVHFPSLSVGDLVTNNRQFFNAGHQAILYFFLKNGAGLHLRTVVTEHPEHLQNLVFVRLSSPPNLHLHL